MSGILSCEMNESYNYFRIELKITLMFRFEQKIDPNVVK